MHRELNKKKFFYKRATVIIAFQGAFCEMRPAELILKLASFYIQGLVYYEILNFRDNPWRSTNFL